MKLFQPYEVEQILLPDNANCLATQAFLKMSKLKYAAEPRSNAEFMSPSGECRFYIHVKVAALVFIGHFKCRIHICFIIFTGKVPFIQCGAFVVAELEPIVSFVASKVSLSNFS